MMFNVWRFVYSFCFLSIIYAIQTKPEHESKYNCTIETVDSGVRDKMKLLLEDGKKVTFIHLSFTNQINLFLDTYRGALYKPQDWVRIAGRHGRSLLFLRPEFEQLSLTTLSLETGYLDVPLEEKPENCLSHFNTTTVEEILRDLLLSDFKPRMDGGSLSEHEYICNMYIANNSFNAKFYYRCCHKGPDGEMVCENLIYDFWIYVVFICVIIINAVAIMFSPYLIPDSFYRKKYARSVYEHTLEKPLQIKVKKIPKQDYDKFTVSIDKLKCMPSFRHFIEQRLPENKEKTLSLSKIHISVQYRKLIPANYAPVGIMETFYTMFVKCHLRKTSSFDACCKGSCLCYQTPLKGDENKHDKKKQKEKCSWYRCLKIFMRILMFIVFSLPWIFRIVFFNWYEKPHTLQRMTAASERNMTLSFQWNLINTLTPMHILFLVCYAVTVVDVVVFGIVSHSIKEKFQLLMRKCLRDMRDMSRSKALEWSALVLVVPFERLGVLGFFLFGIYLVLVLPVILGVLAFYYLPTVNLVVRLFIHFFAYLMPNKEEMKKDTEEENEKKNENKSSRGSNTTTSKTSITFYEMFHLEILSGKESIERPQNNEIKHRLLQLFVLIACISSILSFILLAMEMVLFITEIFIYTIIGIIMNASAMLKYISLIFMLVLYARDCFNGISEKYLEFNKSMNRLIVDQMREKVEKTSNLSEKDQTNTAFQVRFDNTTKTSKKQANINIAVDSAQFGNNTKNVSLVVKDGTLKWRVPRLILFLDVKDTPYLTKRFFKSTCTMENAGVPGPLISNLVEATLRFLCICVFLMFVVLIVLAFGDEYQISGTNQMLATLAGGFLPWVFRNILFKPKDSLALDIDNLSFKSNLLQKIENYEQHWDIDDIVIPEMGKTIEDETCDIDNNPTENDTLRRKFVSILPVKTDRVHHRWRTI